MERTCKIPRISRTTAYLSLLRKIGGKPANKTPLKAAYFTTDHLRDICDYIAKLEKVQPCSNSQETI